MHASAKLSGENVDLSFFGEKERNLRIDHILTCSDCVSIDATVDKGGKEDKRHHRCDARGPVEVFSHDYCTRDMWFFLLQRRGSFTSVK